MLVSIRIEVWGKAACFTRPEMKVERVSYDMMTPSAARGLVEAIYWHPGMKYTIDRIYLLSPIKFTNIRRNEVERKISHKKVFDAVKGKEMPALYTQQEIQQRAS